MKIAFVRELENKRIRIGVGGGEEVLKYSVSASLAHSMGLCCGMELDEGALEAIANEDASYRCMKRALSLLSYGDNTKSALYMKLLRSGFARDMAKACVEECLRLGYIDEGRQIERAVLNEANRSLRGRSYIIKKLVSRGYRSGEVSSVIDGLVLSGEVDFSENFELLCRRRGASTEDERRALSYKMGYRSGDFD